MNEQYKIFQSKLLEKTVPNIYNSLQSDKILQERLHNLLIGKKEEKDDTALLKTNKTDIFYNILSPFSEISESLVKINTSKVFITKGYSKRLGISNNDYLSYHIEYYLNEIYILNQRIKRFTKTYYRYISNDRILDKSKDIIKITDKYFERIRQARDAHVHEKRFTDYGLRRLSYLDLLQNSSIKEIDPFINWMKNSAFKDQRKAWIERIKKNGDDIEIMLDSIFRIVNEDFDLYCMTYK